ncbi:MAG: PIN domain-containing protein [Candidatus Micrarchaeia archaeon]|jgi:predicted nucleic acid-binding protein
MYLDVVVLFALVKKEDYNKPYAERITAMKGEKMTSTAALLELELVTNRELGPEVAMKLDEWLVEKFPKLKIVDFNHRHFQKSLELRKKYGLGILDSLHAAICLDKKQPIASTDIAFDRVPGLARIK